MAATVGQSVSACAGGGERGREGGWLQLGCIQFQTGRQMALEIKDNTADFQVG